MDLEQWLAKCPLIAILRGITPPEIPSIFAALQECGVVIAEVPLNSPYPLESISAATRLFGETMLIGAGTVTEVAQVEQVSGIGGRLIVTPHCDPEIVREAKRLGLITLPGFSTVTEAFALLRAGADGLKIFPAEVGGVTLLKALRPVLPCGTKLIPVGGVDDSTISRWKAAGGDGYGVGSSLYLPGDNGENVIRKVKALLAALEI
jgi:2-dehydro-3-deoxyphosphogalactonate aldolase